ncbi:hypothetical protein OF83DRAFT_937470 [Amylostereum chailletii]|nr:hypothetical protein OF83DRAFT_937470 [Amylostereum chailletii]
MSWLTVGKVRAFHLSQFSPSLPTSVATPALGQYLGPLKQDSPSPTYELSPSQLQGVTSCLERSRRQLGARWWSRCQLVNALLVSWYPPFCNPSDLPLQRGVAFVRSTRIRQCLVRSAYKVPLDHFPRALINQPNDQRTTRIASSHPTTLLPNLYTLLSWPASLVTLETPSVASEKALERVSVASGRASGKASAARRRAWAKVSEARLKRSGKVLEGPRAE